MFIFLKLKMSVFIYFYFRYTQKIIIFMCIFLVFLGYKCNFGLNSFLGYLGHLNPSLIFNMFWLRLIYSFVYTL